MLIGTYLRYGLMLQDGGLHVLLIQAVLRLLLLFDAEDSSHLSHETGIVTLPVDAVSGGRSHLVRANILAQILEDIVGASHLGDRLLLLAYLV